MEAAKTPSESHSWPLRYITFPPRPTSPYAPYVPSGSIRTLGPCSNKFLGISIPHKMRFLTYCPNFPSEELKICLRIPFLFLDPPWKPQTKPYDDHDLSVLRIVIQPEINVAVLHLFIRSLPAGHLHITFTLKKNLHHKNLHSNVQNSFLLPQSHQRHYCTLNTDYKFSRQNNLNLNAV